jgi:hypothetical protein
MTAQKKPIFYGVYIDDPRYKGVIDLVRYLAEPDSFRFSHITLRGPCKQRIGVEELARLNSLVSSWIVTIEGVGNFFYSRQNTVFLSMDIGSLRNVWHKPDYPMGKAHVTLYDGKDRELAGAIFQLARQYDWVTMVKTSKLTLLEPKLATNADFFHQFLDVVRAYERIFPSGRPDLREVALLPQRERLMLIGDILQSLRLPPQRAG